MYKRIEGTVPNFIDENATVVDQYYVRVPVFTEEGEDFVTLNGKKRSVSGLMAKYHPDVDNGNSDDDGTTVVTETETTESEGEKKTQSKEAMIIELFEGNPDLTYKEVTDIMDRQGIKVTSNDIADAKKVWKAQS